MTLNHVYGISRTDCSQRPQKQAFSDMTVYLSRLGLLCEALKVGADR